MKNKKLTALIIDDAYFARDLIKQAFSEIDIEVVGETSNGMEGLELYKELNPDIVTLEIKIHNNKGLDIIKSILSYDRNANILVITSLYNQKAEVLEYGAKEFLSKPFQPAFLWKRIDYMRENNCFDKKNMARESISDENSIVKSKELNGSLTGNKTVLGKTTIEENLEKSSSIDNTAIINKQIDELKTEKPQKKKQIVNSFVDDDIYEDNLLSLDSNAYVEIREHTPNEVILEVETIKNNTDIFEETILADAVDFKEEIIKIEHNVQVNSPDEIQILQNVNQPSSKYPNLTRDISPPKEYNPKEKREIVDLRVNEDIISEEKIEAIKDTKIENPRSTDGIVSIRPPRDYTETAYRQEVETEKKKVKELTLFNLNRKKDSNTGSPKKDKKSGFLDGIKNKFNF